MNNRGGSEKFTDFGSKLFSVKVSAKLFNIACRSEAEIPTLGVEA